MCCYRKSCGLLLSAQSTLPYHHNIDPSEACSERSWCGGCCRGARNRHTGRCLQPTRRRPQPTHIGAHNLGAARLFGEKQANYRAEFAHVRTSAASTRP
eukprot:47747-Chlamydomonas_euryale.AAC.2